jgi:pimeloyl-ACP methyl ester carboxylesterase
MGGRIVGVNGIELWVEEFRPPTSGAEDAAASGWSTVVLVAGAASPSDWWDDELCQVIAGGGHRVVRYDLRDTGQSTTVPAGSADYTGDDLVDDLAGLIEVLDAAPAHVVGLSLGGGLAQQLAIARPELVKSLTLLSTSPGGPGSEGLPPMSPRLAAAFAEQPQPEQPHPGQPEHLQPDHDDRDRDAAFERTLAEERLFGGTIPIDEARIRRISDRIVARSIDLTAGSNHWTVAGASGTRAQLAGITAPTLVVHGLDDPLFPPGHGEALAREIPHARLLLIPGLGHQFPPPEVWPELVPALLERVGDTDRATRHPTSPTSTTSPTSPTSPTHPTSPTSPTA